LPSPRQILRNRRLRAVACWLVSLYIRLVHATGRWRILGDQAVERLADEGRPFVVCLWHGRMLMMPYSWSRADQVHMLISSHIDGQLIAQTIRHFGAKTIAGSSSKGGGGAIRAMLRTLKDRQWVGITPDGPRGPRMRAAAGIVQLARLAGVPIFPVTFGADRCWTLRSWDRFCIPLPLARGVFIWGSPIELPRHADPVAQERARRRVEDGLNEITAQADRLCGRPAVEPAPIPRAAG
jgi:hypothetical protein